MGAVFRAIFGYCFLIVMIRIVGRRPGKQMTPFEFVLIFFIGGVTLTPIVGDDHSLTNALCIIATIPWCIIFSPMQSIAGRHSVLSSMELRWCFWNEASSIRRP